MRANGASVRNFGIVTITGQGQGDTWRRARFKGGPMSPEECAAFRSLPFAEEALRLRRYDDAAKDPKQQTRRFQDIITACQLSDGSP